MSQRNFHIKAPPWNYQIQITTKMTFLYITTPVSVNLIQLSHNVSLCCTLLTNMIINSRVPKLNWPSPSYKGTKYLLLTNLEHQQDTTKIHKETHSNLTILDIKEKHILKMILAWTWSLTEQRTVTSNRRWTGRFTITLKIVLKSNK